jgi:hypothetical protein
MPTRSAARTTALARVPDTADLDDRIAAARDTARVVWRGHQLPLMVVPDLIARTPGRAERDRLFAAWREGVDAVNPLLERRFAAWTEAGDVVERVAAQQSRDPRQLALDLERFVVESETPYYAALRRYLALLDIEQGDGTEADVWHIVRGAAWAHWFGDREVTRGIALTGRAAGTGSGGDGWLAAEDALAGPAHPERTVGEAAVDAAFASVVGSPGWLRDGLGVVPGEVPALADFVAFVNLWRIRRLVGLLRYELRLFAPDPRSDAALARAYYAGMLGHIIGVLVPEEAYLFDVTAPFASARAIEITLLAGQVVEVLQSRFGEAWWRNRDAAELLGTIGAATSSEDVLAQLGYDALDWRPVLRQIRTRLIGEMSGYGGPNITTRAGTRKV